MIDGWMNMDRPRIYSALLEAIPFSDPIIILYDVVVRPCFLMVLTLLEHCVILKKTADGPVRNCGRNNRGAKQTRCRHPVLYVRVNVIPYRHGQQEPKIRANVARQSD